jgi:hypothetical protein
VSAAHALAGPKKAPVPMRFVLRALHKGSEARKRASVVMASAGQVPRVPGRGGRDRQGGEGTGGDGDAE